MIAGVLALLYVDSAGPGNDWRDADCNRGDLVFRTGAVVVAHPVSGWHIATFCTVVRPPNTPTIGMPIFDGCVIESPCRVNL